MIRDSNLDEDSMDLTRNQSDSLTSRSTFSGIPPFQGTPRSVDRSNDYSVDRRLVMASIDLGANLLNASGLTTDRIWMDTLVSQYEAISTKGAALLLYLLISRMGGKILLIVYFIISIYINTNC